MLSSNWLGFLLGCKLEEEGSLLADAGIRQEVGVRLEGVGVRVLSEILVSSVMMMVSEEG